MFVISCLKLKKIGDIFGNFGPAKNITYFMSIEKVQSIQKMFKNGSPKFAQNQFLIKNRIGPESSKRSHSR